MSVEPSPHQQADLRLGIIGAGYLSSARIYPCLHTLPVRLAAVCDLDIELARHHARRFGGEAVFSDHRSMLAEADLDAVIVCVGPAQHAALAIEIMEAGHPVYTEKPPALSAADAREVLETSRRCGAICMTGFKKRFAPVYRAARAAVDDEAFGGASLLSIDYASGSYRNDPADPRSQFLLDFGIHVIDLARYLIGEVAQVSAHRRGYDTYVATLEFASGALGVLALKRAPLVGDLHGEGRTDRRPRAIPDNRELDRVDALLRRRHRRAASAGLRHDGRRLSRRDGLPARARGICRRRARQR